jgi:hypothetical protein
MTVKKSFVTQYDSFGQGPQTSVCIHSNTSLDLDSTSIPTVCLDWDREYWLQVKVDGQSGIKYC